MEHKELTQSQKIMIMIIENLKETTEGRKKLMKLMFLLQHYDLEKNKLVEKGFLDNEFIIYRYGVFSFDVMNDYIDLVNEKIIFERPMRTVDRRFELDEKTINRIISILERFGQKHGFELEKDTLEMLGLNLETKENFIGEPITKFI